MRRRSITYRIFKVTAIAFCIPFILIWILAIMLYIPPLQHYVVEKICYEVSKSSGFDIKINSFRLAFPLKLSVTDFEVSRNDTIFAKGEQAEVNISFTPLLKGEVEANYVSLEKTSINTAGLIPEIKIDGEIGFFRTVARNIDIEKEIANLRQLHIHSTNINVALNEIKKTEDNDSTPINWIFNLHRGNIECCNLTLTVPDDTLSVKTDLGKLVVKNGTIDLGKGRYAINAIALGNTGVKYDYGNRNREAAPLEHLEFNNINLACKNVVYSPDSASLCLNSLTLVQPGGIRITDASTSIFADKKNLHINDFTINSKNGSYIKASTAAPWSALLSDKGSMKAMLSLAVNKKDLCAMLTKEQFNAFEPFENEIFKGEISVDGNISHLNIDTIDIDIPSIAKLEASGEVQNLNDIDMIEARIGLRCQTENLRPLIGEEVNDSTPDARIEATGNIAYAAKTITSDLELTGLDGRIYTTADYDIYKEKYNAEIEIAGIDASTLLSNIPLNEFTGRIHANGEKFDIFDNRTKFDIALSIDTAIYDNICLNDITLNSNLANSISETVLESNSRYLNFNIKSETELNKKNIRNRTSIEISEADLMMLGVTESELATRIKLDLEASTDMQESHAVKFNGKNIEIITQNKKFTPAEINFDFATTPDSSYIMANNGDLHITGAMSSGYNGLFNSFEQIKNMLQKAIKEENTIYYIHDYAKELPDINMEFKCGKQNMLHNFLAINKINVNDMNLDISINEPKGININSGIYGFNTGEINLDTIRFFTNQEGNKIRYLAGIRSTAVNPQEEKLTFSSMLYGNIFNDSITTNFMFRDKKEGVGIRFGLKTIVKPKELDISFRPDAMFFNKKFNFNQGNYITLGSNGNIKADVTLNNVNDAGMHLYTMPDEKASLNANLELFNIDLKEVTGIMPFAPDIAGNLNLELYLNKTKEDIRVSSDIRIDDVAYEGVALGNEALEFVYFPKDEKRHYLDILLRHNDEEVAHLSGDYLNDTTDPGLQGRIILNRFPLNISQAFTKDAGISLNGFVNSELEADGKLSSLSTNGYMQFDSVYLNAPLFGTDLHLSEKNVNITNNKIEFKNFDIYAKGNSPFNLNGTIDLNKLTDPSFNLRMNAKDYELINAPRTRGCMLYGRMFIDLRAFIAGTMNSMKVYGNATLLGKSDITYVMPDAPISTDKELDGLVEFVNFQDTTKVKEIEEEADLGNMNISLGLKIEDGARINADLDANRSSYVMLRGGGNMNMTYTSDNGMNVTGTYTMNDGELKYELPIIPLKTFNIIDGSKVTWSGDLLDPTLEITAIERITTSVNIDESGMQPVAFDVGVKISNTLSNMGLTFTISAPENAIVQDQLNSLDAETLNKYAVTMLITGTYIGNTKGMTVSNALSSFLDAKINNLAGSAMKSVSINVGINDAENTETGNTYKNYSFSFKKRFWNDRLTIVIGGEVNSGDHPAANDSFINNVSLEWKISNNSNRYLRLFYDKNYESLLEGEIIETGIGYVYKKKLQNLRELFIFNKKEMQPKMRGFSQRERGEKPQKGEDR